MKENIIKVVKVEAGQTPAIKEVENNLKALQKEVEGNIECIYLDDGCLVIANEEGKLDNLKPNRRIGTDIICGPFFVCGDDGENFASLSDEQIEKYLLKFKEIEVFTGEEPELEPFLDFYELK